MNEFRIVKDEITPCLRKLEKRFKNSDPIERDLNQKIAVILQPQWPQSVSGKLSRPPNMNQILERHRKWLEERRSGSQNRRRWFAHMAAQQTTSDLDSETQRKGETVIRGTIAKIIKNP